MAGTSELIPRNYAQNEIRARGRVFFDLLRVGISLALSLALHLLVLQWLAFPGGQTNAVAQNQQIVLSFLNAELTQALGTNHVPDIAGPPPENLDRPVSPGPPVIPLREKPDETDLPQPGIAVEMYYPRSALNHPPSLLQDVDLSTLAAIAGDDSKNVVLELFVSEQGTIDRIAFEPGTLDESVQEKLQELLLQLKFSSGEIDGMAVKSRIKIEVMFIAPPKNEKRITLPSGQ